MNKVICILLLILTIGHFHAQQIADTTYNPKIANPMYLKGEGSAIYIDGGHNNFHKKNDRYKPFASLLEKDGYSVYEYEGKFKKKKLKRVDLLVISNAINSSSSCYSAFTKREIKTVNKWVQKGGSLFLIADHMPFGAIAKDLAISFGFEFTNGFIRDTMSKEPGVFTLKNHTLFESTITKGRDSSERVDHVLSGLGQGFKIPIDATPILVFGENHVNYLPDTAFVFNDSTFSYNVKGWSSGAYKHFGEGKIVAFGEAGMFTAQLSGSEQHKFGMNQNLAEENYQLLLNIIHWLDGKLEE